MKHWIRIVLPSELYILAACGSYLIVTGIFFLVEMGQRGNVPPVRASEAGLMVLSFCATAYGMQRVRNFHPACQAEYRNWLKYTPWRLGIPLPLGPVHLVAQDLLIVGLMTGLSSLHEGFRWHAIPSAFIVGYLVFMLFPLILTRMILPVYLMLVGLGGALYLYESPPGLIAIFTALYAIAWAGQRDSLKRIDEWDMEFYDERIAPMFNPQGFQEISRVNVLGWPFDRLIPHRNLFAIHWKFGMALALLVGWWWFVLIEVIEPGRNVPVTAFGIPLAFIMSISRTWTYCWGYVPPLNLWGRIVKFRWIIPGYDVVFLAPLLLISWSLTGLYLEEELNFPASIVGPLQISGLILVNCFCPPSLDSWRLTGNHRIVPATSQNLGELQETK